MAKINKENPKNKITKVEDFLRTTGFIFEMEVAEELIKLDFAVKVNKYFHDYDENKKREIDIIATKRIGDIDIVLIIECKQSLVDEWVFICSDKMPSRYYQYIKTYPSIVDISNKQLTSYFSAMDKKIPIAQNYIIKGINDKKGNTIQIDSCLDKIPKALAYYVYKNKNKECRTMYLPIAVFNGGLFKASYLEKLIVTQSERIQLESTLGSNPYIYHCNHNDLINMYSLGRSVVDDNTEISETCRTLGERYLIEFVTLSGLIKLINETQKQIMKIDLLEWPLK